MALPQHTSQWMLTSANGSSSLELQQGVPIPALDPYEVLVQIHAVSLNSRDKQIVDGIYTWGTKTPVIPCTDCSGTVIAIGNKVTHLTLHDRVTSTFHPKWHHGRAFPASPTQLSQIGAHEDGVLKKHAVFDQEALVPMPTHLSFEEASTLPCAGLTAWSSLFAGSSTVKPGDIVLVEGSGGVSLFAIQFARAAGARVIATSSDPSSARAQRLRDMGVSDVLSYRQADWGQRVKHLTGGRGVDFVVETSGDEEAVRAAIALGGHVAVVGGRGASGVNTFDMRAMPAHTRKVIVGSRDLFEEMVRAIENCGIKPTIDSKVFTFDESPRALEYLARGSQWGKIVIKIV